MTRPVAPLDPELAKTINPKHIKTSRSIFKLEKRIFQKKIKD
jgi:hypothetical protein